MSSRSFYSVYLFLSMTKKRNLFLREVINDINTHIHTHILTNTHKKKL